MIRQQPQNPVVKPVPTGFTLVEVLIALALGMLTLLPALAVFNTTLQAARRHADACRLHRAAVAALESRAAAKRRGETGPELDVQASGAQRVVVRIHTEDSAPWEVIEATADQAGDAAFTLRRTVFPPLRENRNSARSEADIE